MGWPKSSFKFFYILLWKNSNELFSQHKRNPWKSCVSFFYFGQEQPHKDGNLDANWLYNLWQNLKWISKIFCDKKQWHQDTNKPFWTGRLKGGSLWKGPEPLVQRVKHLPWVRRFTPNVSTNSMASKRLSVDT